MSVACSSNGGYSFFQDVKDPSSFRELFASSYASSMVAFGSLQPAGGLRQTQGTGGAGKLPIVSYAQALRGAQSHAMIVQTPDLYSSLNELAVLIQGYDEHGNSDVALRGLTITASMPGAPDLVLTSYQLRGPVGERHTRRYSFLVPRQWFEVANEVGSLATVRTTLNGFDENVAQAVVHGNPNWFTERSTSAGISAYVTSDEAGKTPAGKMRVGDNFYVQLYAHTGGFELSSFEVKLSEDTRVCQMVPASGEFTEGYVGSLQGLLTGEYQVELLNRVRTPDRFAFFTKYSRFGKLAMLNSDFGHLGYVRMRAVGSGICLSSAEITAFSHSGGTQFIPGRRHLVASGDSVTVHGNTLSIHADRLVGVFSQAITALPVVNMAVVTQSDAVVRSRSLSFTSPDTTTSEVLDQTVPREQGGGSIQAVASSGGFSHSVNMAVVRPKLPITLIIDDDTLQELPGECTDTSGSVVYQTTRIRAVSEGVDISRLVSFSTTDASVVSLDTSEPGFVRAIGMSPGTATLYVRDIEFASAVVTVSSSPIGVRKLQAGVATGVQWGFAPTLNRPVTATALQNFNSETSVGWLYVRAHFDDGSSSPVLSGVSASASLPSNQSIAVTPNGVMVTTPPEVSVVRGGSSMDAMLHVQTCLGSTIAYITVNLPPPTAIEIGSDYNTLVPSTNAAIGFADASSSTYVQVLVLFADGSRRSMETDPRISFTVSDDCGDFVQVNGRLQLTIRSTCRVRNLMVRATATMGDVTIDTWKTINVEWLTSLRLETRYQQSPTLFTSSKLKYRYNCGSLMKRWHALDLTTVGTLSSGSMQALSAGLTYTVTGGSISPASGSTTRVLTADDTPGTITVHVQPSTVTDTDSISASITLTSVPEPDSYTFEWDLGLKSLTVQTPFAGLHSTTPKLRYTSGYVDEVADAARADLIHFSSSDNTTVSVDTTGTLMALHNSNDRTPLSVIAEFCDGQRVKHSTVYSNLQPSEPFDYDIGEVYGTLIPATESQQLCIPLRMYSAETVVQFQFVLRFPSDILECSSRSCGSWTAGADWRAFGTSAAMSTDSGQVDFATVASVISLNKRGLLDIGTLCLDVIGSGSLELKVQSKVHIDTRRSWGCFSDGAPSLYEEGTRCYSRTPEVTFNVQSRRRLAPSDSHVYIPREGPRPMNIDSFDDQLTMSDCLYLGTKQQELAGFPEATQTFLDSLEPIVAQSYNPNMDYYVGTNTSVVDPADLTCGCYHNSCATVAKPCLFY